MNEVIAKWIWLAWTWRRRRIAMRRLQDAAQRSWSHIVSDFEMRTFGEILR